MKKRVLSLMLVVTLLASILSSGMLSATAAISPTTGSANDGVDFTALMAGNIYLGKYNHATSFATTTYGLATKEAVATPVLWKVMGEEQTNDNLDAGANITGDGNLTLMSRYVLDSAVYSKGTVYTAPYVTFHPADISVIAGSNAAFSVVYAGVAPTYQWQLDTGSGFADIASATAATYTATAVTAGQNGYKYRCVLKKTGQSDAISNAATLSVVATAPVVRTNPSSVGKAVGQSAVFTVLQGGGVVSFQWKVSTDGGASFTPISGATAATYVIPYVSSSDNGKLFQCAVTSSLGTATSSNAALNILTSNPQPVFAISNIRDFLNNNFNATNTFNGAEYSSIPATNVVNRYINNSNRTERIVTDYSGFYWPNTTSQKLYIPSGFNMTGLANKLSWGASTSVVKNIAGASGVVSDVKNSVDTSTNFALGKLKGATTQYVNYYTKDVYGSGFTTVNLVSGGVNPAFSVTNSNVIGTDYGKLQGVRPAFKLDPAKIVYANKITTAGNGYAVGSTEGDNYKLTLVQGDSGTLNLSNLKKDNVSLSNNQTVTVAPDSTLNLTGSTSLSENNVMYKIVDSNHNIVSYGQAAAPGSTSISIPSTNLSGDYNLYLWEQQSNSNISNVASNPVHYSLHVGTSVSVYGVSLNLTTMSIIEGQMGNLIETVTPVNATNKSVTWSTSNSSVATVSSNGIVTAVLQGTATITVKTVDGDFISNCVVTVLEATPVINVTGISLNKTYSYIYLGRTENLITNIYPEGATNKDVTWSTSNSAIATVSDGIVTGVSSGSATISVKTNDGNYSSTCTVIIINLPPIIFQNYNHSGSTVTKISPNMTVENFRSGLSIRNDSILEIKKGNVILGQNDLVGTGTKLSVDSQELLEPYYAVIYGDTNGDALINVLDLLEVKKHLLKLNMLSSYNYTAGDTDNNKLISIFDFLAIKKHILNIYQINQNDEFAVNVINNIKYGQALDKNGVMTSLMFDVYEPNQNNNLQKPAIILIHGGGFGGGDKQQFMYIKMATEYAKKGYVAFSINYRLLSTGNANDAEYYRAEGVNDAQAALNYIKANSNLYGINPNKIVVCGDSAGGAIAVALSFNNSNSDGVAVCIDLWGGMPTTAFPDTYPWNGQLYSQQISSLAPPTLIIHGTIDVTVPYSVSINLSERLNTANVSNKLIIIEGAKHYPETYSELFIPEMIRFSNEKLASA